MTRQGEIIHASCIAFEKQGLLILGRPGAGKSSLALSLIDGAGRGLGDKLLQADLVADDQVMIEAGEGRLWASPPPALAGRIEVRGVGILHCRHVAPISLVLAVDLRGWSEIERLPPPQAFPMLGTALPLITLDAGLAGAAARLRAAFSCLEEGL